ncbi:hypothetical protein, partial [Clostridium sp.]|uniref:hypothetical protein n=1 Tax=Clostridium sp. TaxID=1506 RepID=UPI003464DBD2
DKDEVNTVNVNSHIPSEYSYENVVDKNYAIKIYKGLKEEVINLSVIEDFIKNYNDKKPSEIFLIEYLEKDNVKKVKNLMNLKFNGEEGTLIKYDVSNEKEFKEGTRKKFKKIVKSGDNTGVNIVLLEDELQSPLEGESIFTYEEGASKEYK